MADPYRSTPVFDEISLPAALRNEHSTKAGVWGLICVIEGQFASPILMDPARVWSRRIILLWLNHNNRISSNRWGR